MHFESLKTQLSFSPGAINVARAVNLPDDAKSLAVKVYDDHLMKVVAKCSFLWKVIEDVNNTLPPESQLGIHDHKSYTGTVHFSFDFAQLLQFPNNPLQAGLIYFKVPRRCGLFGVN